MPRTGKAFGFDNMNVRHTLSGSTVDFDALTKVREGAFGPLKGLVSSGSCDEAGMHTARRKRRPFIVDSRDLR
jgi:hypothetical protein